MASRYEIEINVRPHIKKYLIHHLNNKPITYDTEQPIELTNRNVIGLFITNLLKEQSFFDKKKKENKAQEGKIKVSIPERYYKDIDPRYKFIGIDESSEIRIDRFLDSLLKMELFIFCDAYRATDKLKIKDAITDFMDYYNITEEDIKHETLYRKYKLYVKNGKPTRYRV